MGGDEAGEGFGELVGGEWGVGEAEVGAVVLAVDAEGFAGDEGDFVFFDGGARRGGGRGCR